jgi:hypothetical protein
VCVLREKESKRERYFPIILIQICGCGDKSGENIYDICVKTCQKRDFLYIGYVSAKDYDN